MKIGFVGLGRMGENMVLNLLDKRKYVKKVVAFNRSPEPTRRVSKKGAIGVYSLSDLVSNVGNKNRVIWLMIPASVVDNVLRDLKSFLKKGDIVIDGGNSYYKDSQRRFKELKKCGVSFLDVGVSGGVEGARRGSCMIIGGEKKIFLKVEKFFRDMCVKDGYGYVGTSGAGHFVKGIHNGIEYGMMGAIAEGMNAIESKKKNFGTDLNEVVKVYAHGSIIESRLVSWLEKGMNRDYFSKVSGKVPKGETEEEMKELMKFGKMGVLREAVKIREDSRRVKGSFMGKLIAVMRNEFGGHAFNRKI